MIPVIYATPKVLIKDRQVIYVLFPPVAVQRNLLCFFIHKFSETQILNVKIFLPKIKFLKKLAENFKNQKINIVDGNGEAKQNFRKDTN